jgi:hypothetical protein
MAHGLIFGQVFINAAKGIPTAQPIKNANERRQGQEAKGSYSEVYIIHLPNIVCQSSINPTAIRVVGRYLCPDN